MIMKLYKLLINDALKINEALISNIRGVICFSVPFEVCSVGPRERENSKQDINSTRVLIFSHCAKTKNIIKCVFPLIFEFSIFFVISPRKRNKTYDVTSHIFKQLST